MISCLGGDGGRTPPESKVGDYFIQAGYRAREKLLEVLSRNEDAIGWTLTDLKGLDPSLCTHRIFLEDDSRPIREAQRRLNPKVWEAVKKEILKWLNAEIIYPISDSQWVSPVHVVPKKAVIMVTTNKKGEEIQTPRPKKWRVCIDYRKLSSATKRIISRSRLSTKSWTDWQDQVTSASSTDIRATIRLQFISTIKRRRRSHVLLALLPLNACHLDCAMPPRPFNDV